MGFNHPGTLALPANTPIRIGLCRQAAYPAWADQTASVADAYIVDYYSMDSTVASPATAEENVETSFVAIGSWSVGNRVASNRPTVTGAAGGYFRYPVVGVDGSGLPFTYSAGIVNGGTFIVTIPVAQAWHVYLDVTVEVWTQPGEVAVVEERVTINPGWLCGEMSAVPFARFGNCWVRPRRIIYNRLAGFTPQGLWFSIASGTRPHYLDATNGTYVVQTTPSRAFYPLALPVEFSNSRLPWAAARTTASAFLGTNVSQVLNKAGTVLCGRVSPNVENMFSVTPEYIAALHPAEKQYLGLETGFYSYVPPSTDMANFWDYTLPDQGYNTYRPAAAPVFRLDNDSLQNVVFCTAGAVDESIACNIDWHIEFRTSSALFQVGLSTMTLESLHQAQLTLASLGYFFQNESHKSILNRLISAARTAAPYMMAIAKVAGPLPYALAKGAAKAGKLILSDKPKPPPPATSAMANGIVSKRKRVKARRKKVK